VSRDPLARLPTALRLWAAAALCVVPLGLSWSFSSGFLSSGYYLYGDCGYSADAYCTPDQYVPGSYLPGHSTIVSQSPLRVFLVLAAVALAFTATRVRTEATRRVARIGTGAIAVGAVQAAANGASVVLICLVAALLLAAPPAWNNPAARGVLDPASLRR
jgi:hypothetical protein